MTTTPDPKADISKIVEALEYASKVESQAFSYMDAAWLRKKAEEALPLAHSLAKQWDEMAEALNWLLQFCNEHSVEISYYTLLNAADCPAIIKRMT